MSGRADLDPAAFEDDDRRLGGTIARAGNVVLGIVLDDAGSDPAPPPAAVRRRGLDGGDRPALRGRPARALRAAFRRRGRFRRALVPKRAARPGDERPGFCGGRRRDFPGLPWRRCGWRRRRRSSCSGTTRTGSAVGQSRFPSTRRPRCGCISRPASHGPARTIPAWEILAGERRPGGALADKLVLIGSSAPEAGAFLPLAGAALAPTVQIQAEAIEQILPASFLKRPDFVVWWEALAMLALGSRRCARRAAAAGLGGSVGLRDRRLLARRGRRFSHLRAPHRSDRAGGGRHLRRQRDGVRRLHPDARAEDGDPAEFERYVPPEVVARLVREPETLRLDGELREVTALLTDVEGFSSMTEKSDPRCWCACSTTISTG